MLCSTHKVSAPGRHGYQPAHHPPCSRSDERSAHTVIMIGELSTVPYIITQYQSKVKTLISKIRFFVSLIHILRSGLSEVIWHALCSMIYCRIYSIKIHSTKFLRYFGFFDILNSISLQNQFADKCIYFQTFCIKLTMCFSSFIPKLIKFQQKLNFSLSALANQKKLCYNKKAV